MDNRTTSINSVVIVPLILVCCLTFIRWYSGVLLFHTLAELFSVVVGILMLVIAWNTRHFTRNSFLLYLGIGYFWVAVLDTWHTFTVKGIPFFDIPDAEITLHFWVYTRLLEALLLLSAVIFLKKRVNAYLMFGVGGVITLLIVWASMMLERPLMLSPDGLTTFKVAAEYLVMALLLLAGYLYIQKRQLLAPRVLQFLLISMTLTIFAELSFTLYTDFHGTPFMVGHLFKFLSFWMIYQAIVQTTLREPFTVMAQASTSYDAIPHPAVVVDDMTIISQVNRAAEESSGRSKEELIHKPVHRYFHPNNFPEEQCELCQAIKDGRSIDGQLVHFPDRGKWFLVSLSPIKVGDTSSGMVELLTDVTERHEAEELLRKNETHMRTLIETLPDLVWLKDAEGVYLACNPKFERFFGAKQSEIIGKTDYDFVDKELADFFREHDRAAMAAGEPTSNEEEITYADDGHREILETIKTPMVAQDGTLIGVLGVARDITERKHSDEAIREREQQIRDLLDSTAEAIYGLDLEGNCTFANPACAQILGYQSVDELVGNNMHKLIHHTHSDGSHYPVEDCPIYNAFQSGDGAHIDNEVLWRADGSSFPAEYWSYPIRREGEVVGAVVTFVDITKRMESEEALRRSQKMDAIGQLTGGIAHDFNNILGIILGNVDLLEQQNEADEKTYNRVVSIQKAAQRAADLTKQLLGFSRRQPTQHVVTNINNLINDMDSLIARSLTPEVEVEHFFTEDLWSTEIDPGDFEDTLLNLILNARDAMEGRGKLCLETRNVDLDASYCENNPGVKPGQYVQLAVSDTGKGIPVEDQDRIFEPFFTTKKSGKGTGLGLAMVFGFAKRSGGHIKVYSEPGIGTTFRLYLPRTDGDSYVIDAGREHPEPLPGGHEVILVVDDEEGLLELAQESLEGLGYRVMTATSGREALKRLADESDIKLLFSDVVMPGGMNGYELADKAFSKYPGLKVLLTSGYTEKVIAYNGQARFNANLLSKPYSQEELALRVREMLDGTGSDA